MFSISPRAKQITRGPDGIAAEINDINGAAALNELPNTKYMLETPPYTLS